MYLKNQIKFRFLFNKFRDYKYFNNNNKCKDFRVFYNNI